MKVKPAFLLTYLFIGLILGWVSFYSRPLKIDYASKFQQAVWVDFTGDGNVGEFNDPVLKIHSSRILFPALMQIPHKLGLSVEKSFSIVRLLTGILALILFHAFLLYWFSDELAFAGTLFMAATLPLTFNNWFEIPTDYIEIIVFTIGIWAILESRYGLLCALVFVGTFSRETTAVLPFFLFFKLFSLKDFRWLIPVFCSGLAWLVPLVALRLWVGAVEAHGYGHGFVHNFDGLYEFVKNPHPYNNYLFWLYLFGAFWFLPYLGWKHQPDYFKRFLIAVPIMVVVYFSVGGFFDEPRELVNLYPVLVPASLWALFPMLSATNNRNEPTAI
jgi:hypothetical protein